jgi:hypothetical protein
MVQFLVFVVVLLFPVSYLYFQFFDLMVIVVVISLGCGEVDMKVRDLRF